AEVLEHSLLEAEAVGHVGADLKGTLLEGRGAGLVVVVGELEVAQEHLGGECAGLASDLAGSLREPADDSLKLVGAAASGLSEPSCVAEHLVHQPTSAARRSRTRGSALDATTCHLGALAEADRPRYTAQGLVEPRAAALGRRLSTDGPASLTGLGDQPELEDLISRAVDVGDRSLEHTEGHHHLHARHGRAARRLCRELTDGLTHPSNLLGELASLAAQLRANLLSKGLGSLRHLRERLGEVHDLVGRHLANDLELALLRATTHEQLVEHGLLARGVRLGGLDKLGRHRGGVLTASE